MNKRGGFLGTLILIVLLSIIGLIIYAVIGMTGGLCKEEEDVSQEEAKKEQFPAISTIASEEAVAELETVEGPDDCETVELKDRCYLYYAIDLQDRSLCERISEGVEFKEKCLEQL